MAGTFGSTKAERYPLYPYLGFLERPRYIKFILRFHPGRDDGMVDFLVNVERFKKIEAHAKGMHAANPPMSAAEGKYVISCQRMKSADNRQ